MSFTRQTYRALVTTCSVIRSGLSVSLAPYRIAGIVSSVSRSSSNSILSRLRCSSATLIKMRDISKLCNTSKTCSCGMHKASEGDKDLINFLEEELAYEQGTLEDCPQIEGFKVNVEGTKVALSRRHNDESITVNFDINENINVDKSEGEDLDTEEESGPSKIVSYPSFSVKIVKDSGRTLQLKCSFNYEFNNEEQNEPEDNFNIDSLTVSESEDDVEGVYDSETDNMDPNLYQLLMNFLYERRINYEFSQNILDFSTKLEHRHYVFFLEDLKGFVSSN